MDPFSLPQPSTAAARAPQDQPSPTKRRKVSPLPPPPLDATLSTSSLLAFALPPSSAPPHPPQPPLARVPAPVALIALAVSLRTSAQALLASLAKRPSSTSTTSQHRYAQAWADYSRTATASIIALRAAVHLTASASDYAGGRLELRACAMLAQALVDLYDGSGSEHVVAPEADRVLSRAVRPLPPRLSLFQCRPRPRLTRPLLGLQIAISQSVRLARLSLTLDLRPG